MTPTAWKKIGALAVTLALPALAAAAGAARQEGNWQVTVKMEMVGMPMAMPPITTNQCVTNKDLVPDMSQRDQNCIVREQKVEGDTVSWRMQCKSKDGTMDGQGKIKYADTAYEGEMQMTMTQPGHPPMNMKYAMKGKHTGPCTANSKKAKRADDY
ncbi:MAG: DUF3617 family protein [Burkholderiales bacterium]